MASAVRRVGMLLFDSCDLLDFAGPTATFDAARRMLHRAQPMLDAAYSVRPLSIDGGPIRTLQGIMVETDAAAALGEGEFDTIIVTGSPLDHTDCDPRLIEWVANNEKAVRRVASVCCGAFILCATGVMAGRGATTHWEDCERLRSFFPDVDVRPDSIYVQDGKYWTAAGISSGIDMALAMIEEDHGHALALAVARNLVVFLKRPGGQSQFSAPLQSQTIEGPLAPVLNWIVENPCADLSSEALADRAHMSLRNFYRAFRVATGISPADWVEMTRMEVAKRLLAQTAQRADTVAFSSGFGSYERMRKAFARRLGISPGSYRARFAPPDRACESAAAMAALAGVEPDRPQPN